MIPTHIARPGHPVLALSLAILLLLSAACASPHGASDAHAKRDTTIDLTERPPSAHGAVVRMLETLDANQTPDAPIRVRAVTADTLNDRRHGGEVVRIVFDLTIFAPDYASVDRMFESLQAALDAEAAATARTDAVAPMRNERVFDRLDWGTSVLRDERTYAGLVSLSRAVRAEVRAPRGRLELARELAWSSSENPRTSQAAAAHPANAPMDAYIQEAASHVAEDVGVLHIESKLVPAPGGHHDIRYRIRPLDTHLGSSRAEIGRFLQSLESRSPGVRITHISLSPAEPGADVEGDCWTFETDVTVRLQGESTHASP